MKRIEFDTAVIGGGAAGLCAAAKCAENDLKTVIIERENRTGGVLNQCIHSGFGVHYFQTELTGPEYALRLADKLKSSDVEIMLGASVTAIAENNGKYDLTVYSKTHGVFIITARTVILAMGCRERCRGNIGIPGERCAGVFNAGFAQQLINTEGYLPGSKAVIVGSGDIGLIMARRLTWSGVKVECVVEIMPYPAGLSRNIAQCLEDFSIPLHLAHTVTEICGRERVEGVKIAPLVNGEPDLQQEKFIACDTVLFSVGLVPENEIARLCGIELDPVTKGAKVDGNLMTSKAGIFACGNVLHVHDLVDFVSQEAERAAVSAVRLCKGTLNAADDANICAAEGVRYVVPQKFSSACGGKFFMRSTFVADTAQLTVKNINGEVIFSKKLHYVKPAEMLTFELPPINSIGAIATLEKL